MATLTVRAQTATRTTTAHQCRCHLRSGQIPWFTLIWFVLTWFILTWFILALTIKNPHL